MSGSSRDQVLDSVLAEMVRAESRPSRSRRLRWGLSIGSFAAAGVLAGSLTAGALAIPASNAAQLQDQMVTFAAYQLNDGTLVGSPLFEQSSGPRTIAVPPRPADGDQIVVGLWCLGSRSASVDLGGSTVTSECHGHAAKVPEVVRSVDQDSPFPTVRVEGDSSYAIFISWYKQAPNASASAAQKAAVADGVVTRQEYLDGYARLVGCMGQAGFEMGSLPANEVVLHYALTEAQRPTFDHECYPREFEQIDVIWQGQVEERATACLAGIGVAPARDGTEWDDQLRQHGLDPVNCGLLQ